MLEFTLRPYIGADPITFEMAPSQVAKVLGPPTSARQNSLGERAETRAQVSVRYSPADQKVVELAFVPGARLLFQGRSLFEAEDLIQWLMTYDQEPYEHVGFIFFFELGITVTGFHDQDESQKAICVYRKGRLDKYRADAVPYTPQDASKGEASS